MLYPTNCNAAELAGITGDTKLAETSLIKGGGLDSSNCSWVYFQGFKASDPPEIAILWEARENIGEDGKLRPLVAHSVLLLGGVRTNVSLSEWPEFAKKQEALREHVLRGR
jgi:hypothetical protein